ncbi:WhiB family transcriptional regulator [Candidatus Saccharibacteria bacterium]|nr:WhiB family transcriptional regulator [Candidatus Saccharibacteria bacterium]
MGIRATSGHEFGEPTPHVMRAAAFAQINQFVLNSGRKEQVTEIIPLETEPEIDIDRPPINTASSTALPPLNWDSEAIQKLRNCIDKPRGLFFPEPGPNLKDRQKLAKAICAECIINDLCLDEALKNSQNVGIWGGTTKGERKKIINARSQAAQETEVA